MARIRYRRLEHQKKFHDSRKFFDILSCGYGGGKTYSLAMKGFQLMQENFGLPGGILVPNTKMFFRDVYPTIDDICTANRIRYKFNEKKMFYYFPQTRSRVLIFHDEDKGKSIKGPNLAFMLINEIALISELGFKAAIARVRLKRAKLLQVAGSGTPEGFNWVYDFFVAEPRQDADVIFADARSNIHVADIYFKMLLDSYDDKMAQMYVGGKYINLNGLAALYKFDRLIHTAEKVEPDQNGRIIAHLDFNVSPMCGTFYTWNAKKRELRGFLEIHVEDDASTENWCRKAKRELAEFGIENIEDIELFPDPAGNSRSTRSQSTDIDILEEQGFKNLKYKTRILSVRDCLNASNRFLHRENVVLDRTKCKHTIRDFEKTSIKAQGGFELDKSDPKLTHYVDGFKNMIEYEFPISTGAGDWKRTQVR